MRLAWSHVLAVACIAGMLVAPAPLLAQRAHDASASSDSTDAVAAVERFRAALSRGDSAAVLAILAPDAVILESGDVETRAEYRRHHLPADIEYARAMPGTHTLVSAIVQGDAAWVSTTSVSRGRMKGKTVNSAGAELIVLSRRNGDSPWQIRAIHWSSRRRAS